MRFLLLNLGFCQNHNSLCPCYFSGPCHQPHVHIQTYLWRNVLTPPTLSWKKSIFFPPEDTQKINFLWETFMYFKKITMSFTSLILNIAAAAKSLQSCLTLCNPIDSSPPGFSVPGTLQARTLEWIAISFSNACMHAKSLQSCQSLCDPMDSSPPGSSVHRILQARIMERVATSFCT